MMFFRICAAYLIVVEFEALISVLGYPMSGSDDVVFLARTKKEVCPIDPLAFDHVGVDKRSSYDQTSSRFYTFQDGVYLVSASAGAKEETSAPVCLHGESAGLPACVFLNGSSHNGVDTFSRDAIMSMKFLQSLRMVGFENGSIYSDAGLQTSLSVVRISDWIYNPRSFSAVRTAPFNGKDGPIIPFSEVLVNTGSHYDSSSGTYKVPLAGYYFLSFSVAVYAYSKFEAALRQNTKILGTLVRHSTTQDSSIMSRAGLYYLKTGDTIFISMNATSNIYSGWGHEASFMGFRYSWTYDEGWTVARTSSWSDKLFLSPVPFDVVVTNTDNKWDSVKHVYYPINSGYFYVTITVGALPYVPVHVHVIGDFEKLISLVRTSTSQNGVDVLSRSAIVYLKRNTAVYVAAEGNTGFYSDVGQQTTFTGFRISS